MKPALRPALAAGLFALAAQSGILRAEGPEAPPATVTIDGQSLSALGFNLLASFPFVITDAGTGATAAEIQAAKARDQIPARVRAFDRQRVVLTGYMLPLTFENGLSRSFILMRDQNTCCYGAVPNMNDYVVVTMRAGGVTPIQDIPVQLVGIFRIDQRYEGDYLTSLYVLEGERFLGPERRTAPGG